MSCQILTQAELKKVLSYNPETGIFIWKKKNGVPEGKIAGSHDEKGYLRIRIYKKSYRVHRLAFLYMTGDMPEFVDHQNHIRDDNRWTNIVPATKKTNGQNSNLSSNNKSGITGVFWHKHANKWVAKIVVDSRRIHLGCFLDIADAIKARLEAEKIYGFHENHGIRGTIKAT